MTKAVRIENADTSSYKVVVQVFEYGRNATPDDPGMPDRMVSETVLQHPTQLDTFYIHSGRYIIVKEA